MVNLVQTSRCRLRLALNQMHQRKKDVLNEQHTLQRNMIRVEIRVSELEQFFLTNIRFLELDIFYE